jgi:hypothetical protein
MQNHSTVSLNTGIGGKSILHSSTSPRKAVRFPSPRARATTLQNHCTVPDLHRGEAGRIESAANPGLDDSNILLQLTYKLRSSVRTPREITYMYVHTRRYGGESGENIDLIATGDDRGLLCDCPEGCQRLAAALLWWRDYFLGKVVGWRGDHGAGGAGAGLAILRRTATERSLMCCCSLADSPKL